MMSVLRDGFVSGKAEEFLSDQPPHTKHKQTYAHIIFSYFKLFYDSSHIALYSQNLSLIFISPAYKKTVQSLKNNAIRTID